MLEHFAWSIVFNSVVIFFPSWLIFVLVLAHTIMGAEGLLKKDDDVIHTCLLHDEKELRYHSNDRVEEGLHAWHLDAHTLLWRVSNSDDNCDKSGLYSVDSSS